MLRTATGNLPQYSLRHQALAVFIGMDPILAHQRTQITGIQKGHPQIKQRTGLVLRSFAHRVRIAFMPAVNMLYIRQIIKDFPGIPSTRDPPEIAACLQRRRNHGYRFLATPADFSNKAAQRVAEQRQRRLQSRYRRQSKKSVPTSFLRSVGES